MTGHAVPPPERIRREAVLVTAAYALPLGLIAGQILVNGRDPSVLALVLSLLCVGALEPIARRMRARWRDWGNPPVVVDGVLRDLILSEAPALSRCEILVRRTGGELSIDGERLFVGWCWLTKIRIGEPIPPNLFFGLAHEARHLAVGTARILRLFRLMRSGYLAVSGGLFAMLVFNAALAFDDPYRSSLIIAVVFIPLLAAAQKVVMDLTCSALEWRLEIDADAAATQHCRASGRIDAIAERLSGLLPSRATAGHVPVGIRRAAFERKPVWGTVVGALIAGWLAAVMPLAMLAVITRPGADVRSDVHLSMTAVYAVVLSASALMVLSSTGSRHTSTARSRLDAACWFWMRAYGSMMSLLFYVTAFLLSAFVWALASGGIAGNPPSWPDCLLTLMLIGAAIVYVRVRDTEERRRRWTMTAAALDAARLWLTIWILRASGSLPFIGDPGALGQAMQEHPDLVTAAALRALGEEPIWLACMALASILISSLFAALVFRSWAATPP